MLWVELVPKHPDVDAVADHFFTSKGKNKGKVFMPKQGIELYLVITHEKYNAILQHLSVIEEVINRFASDSVSKYSMLYFLGPSMRREWVNESQSGHFTSKEEHWQAKSSRF